MGSGTTPYLLEHVCNTYILTSPKQWSRRARRRDPSGCEAHEPPQHHWGRLIPSCVLMSNMIDCSKNYQGGSHGKSYQDSNPHLSKEEIQERIKATVGFWRVQKWLVLWNALVDPRPAREIALHTGIAEQSVHNLISRYNRLGPEAVEGPGKGGRRRSYLSWDEEASFLESFKQAALTPDRIDRLQSATEG